MLDESLYALAVLLGSLMTCASREWARTRPEELRGAFQGTTSFVAGFVYFSLIFFPFLLWPWWVGIVVPLGVGVLAGQVMIYSPLMGWIENRGITRTKNVADLLLIALGVMLWVRFFGGA